MTLSLRPRRGVTPASLVAALLLCGTAALAGCSGSDSGSGSGSGAGRADDPATSASPDSPGPAASESTAAGPWRVVGGPLDRCGPQPPAVADATWRYRVLKDPDVGAVPTAYTGSGRTVAVLLHQTDGNGLCGWLPFAEQLASAGLAALAIDLCRFGDSSCPGVQDGSFTDADQTGPVRMAVEHARRDLGARRVVVVGASMGGSVALMSGAELPGVDAVVDLSGPVDWAGIESARGGRAVEAPVLLAMAEDEGPEQVAGARAIVDRAPAGSRLVLPDAGHGYELLTDPDGGPLPLSDEVVAWVRRGPA